MLIPAQNSNKANYKIQDCFVNRQIKENVKCNIFFMHEPLEHELHNKMNTNVLKK
jgi:hypothetical protein